MIEVVAADVGSTDDPQALAFWQSSDVLGFSDYQRLFMFLEHADTPEQEAESSCKANCNASVFLAECHSKHVCVSNRWESGVYIVPQGS